MKIEMKICYLFFVRGRETKACACCGVIGWLGQEGRKNKFPYRFSGFVLDRGKIFVFDKKIVFLSKF